ncbi:hypothetical protein BC938DRAFT_472904 [Jimgerdemannia flammicorona]|uniref:Uncharacterized protein n=1 Tax=Jimgerdemannia flammicorona TaxID=994334 RepID=A0A433QTR5_9FUNG|nr:hypothetical protein BC938DRAFT_472904 [Jimgerdemannia flammicorona]
MTALPHSNSFHLISLTSLCEDKTISQSASEPEKLGKRRRSGSGSGSGSGSDNGFGSSVSHSSDSSSHHSGSGHSGIQGNLEEEWGEFVHPAGVKPKHKRIVTWLGKIGFTAKGIVYGLIGGMIYASANRFNLPGIAIDNGSP